MENCKSRIINKSKREHVPGCTCSLCGNQYDTFVFKGGYVCESCLDEIKYTYNSDKNAFDKPHTSSR